MNQSQRFLVIAACCACCPCILPAFIAIEDAVDDTLKRPNRGIEMVEVGDPGNPADRSGLGAVNYAFQISKYEVTNMEYAAFLNAVAAKDPNGVYHPKMMEHPLGGIIREGKEGAYRYGTKPLMADKPVVFLSFWDRCRFCNWHHNGRPRGGQEAATTEDGAYDLTDAEAVLGNQVSRKAGARFFLPDDSEWYKAAYYDPREEEDGGPPGDDHYWLYPTRSDNPPVRAGADEEGCIDNARPNIANYDRGAKWGGQEGHLTTVGSGGPGSRSYYGVYDMGGNVFEPNESIRGRFRGLRGGAWHISEDRMRSSASFIFDVFQGIGENERVGFRLAAPAADEEGWPEERVKPAQQGRRPVPPPGAVPAAQPLPKAQADQLNFGGLGQGDHAEGSVRIFAKGDAQPGGDFEIAVPDFVRVTGKEEERDQNPRLGNRRYLDLFFEIDTTRVRRLLGAIKVEVGGERLLIPVEAEILPPDPTALRVLVIDTPFERFSTGDGRISEGWVEVAKRGKLRPTYIDSHRLNGSIFDGVDMKTFDAVVLGEGGVLRIGDDALKNLKRFVEDGGRVVVAANVFMNGSIPKANRILNWGGMMMIAEERGLVREAGAQIVANPFTKGIERAIFHRGSPVEIIDAEKARLLVKATPHPGMGYVAVGRHGKGAIFALGQSLWWSWVGAERFDESDNRQLILNLLSKPLPARGGFE